MSAPRQPGRPRSAAADEAILAATTELLAECGLDGVTMEAVATRAGVGKATIYRRWPGRDALVLEALERLSDDGAPPVTGRSVRDDLVALLTALRRRQTRTLAGRIMPRLVGASDEHLPLLARYHERVSEPRRQAFREVLGRGVAAGELRADLDVELAVDLLVGTVLFQEMVARHRPAGSRAAVADVVDTVLAGALSSPAAPAAAPPAPGRRRGERPAPATGS